MGWEDGVQFQFLASQNTMTALIGGTTVHSWGVIPVNATDAQETISTSSKDGDIDALCLNALGMRWLIVDEVSTLSPEVLGLLDSYLRRACKRHPHARQHAHVRPFGGTRQTLCWGVLTSEGGSRQNCIMFEFGKWVFVLLPRCCRVFLSRIFI